MMNVAVDCMFNVILFVLFVLDGPAVGQQALIPPEAQWPILQPPSRGLTQ